MCIRDRHGTRADHAAHGWRDPPLRGQRHRDSARQPRPAMARRAGFAQPDRLSFRGDPMPASYQTHRSQLQAILSAWGMSEENAEATADILSWADLHGVDSHGISMIPGYDRLRRQGRANMQAKPRIVKETPISALVDG